MNQVDLYCEIARERYLSQEWLNREFQTRVGFMISFGGAMIGAGAVILKSSPSDLSFPIFLALVAAYLSTIGWTLPVLWPRRWQPGPKISEVADRLDAYKDEVFTKLVGDVYGRCVENNRGILDSKSTNVQIGTVSLVLETAALATLSIVTYLPL